MKNNSDDKGLCNISIVIPALNEELTIGEFVEWCKEGLNKACVEGQILIVDSSSDRTPEIAKNHGAEVLCVPKRGLGRAYIDALPYIRGKYVLMGDCDLTYDFRDISGFIAKFEAGYEFVMGSRYKGYIEKGAMPILHQYFGTPITTWILNVIYSSIFSDIHCGMRGITLEGLRRINLQSQSWEYASEMVLKAAKLRLKTTEVPVRFYKDREGRVSHHKRIGWYSSWVAGWINLRSMLIYAPDFFLWIPGWLLFFIGIILTFSLTGGPYNIGKIGLNLHWMLLGITMTTLGYSAIQLSILARIYYQFDKLFVSKMRKIVTYDRGVISGIALFILGFILNMILLIRWQQSGLKLSDFYHPALLGLMLIILGFQTFTFTLLLLMIINGQQRNQDE